MISPRCFKEAWIREQAAALRARDLRTLEKNIVALELVSRLRREGLEFIFRAAPHWHCSLTRSAACPSTWTS